MKILQAYSVILLLFVTPCYAGILSRSHTAVLIVGQGQNEVLEQAKHILGVPTRSENMSAGDSQEFVWQYYSYTDEYDIALIFSQGSFFQLIVEEKKPEDMPYIGSIPGLRGYLLSKTGNKIEIKLLGNSGAKLSSDMLTTKALDIAWHQYKSGDFSTARQLAVKVIQSYPGNADAFNLLGVLDLHDGKLESAIEQFQKAIQVLAGQTEKRKDYILNNLGMAYIKAKDYANAHNVFEESIAGASDLNCAGRIGGLLSLINLNQEDRAKEIIKPCNDQRQVKATLEELFDFFELTNDPLKKQALALMAQL